MKTIESKACLTTQSLTRLASNDKLFLSRDADFTIKSLSSRELQRAIINIRDLLDQLRRFSPPDFSVLARHYKHKTEVTFDPTYLANLEHLLLCLQAQLLQQLVLRCIGLVREHIIECQKNHERSCEDWFFEYPDARHPLSTTWPWAIKLSLAVLWGVCWMFFGPLYWDNEDYLTDREGEIRVSRQEIERLFSNPQSQQTAQQEPARRSISRLENSNSVGQMSSAGVLYPRYLSTSASATRVQPLNRSHLPMMVATQPQQHTRSRPGNSLSRIHNNAYSESWEAPFCLSYSKADSEAASQNQAAASLLGLAPGDSNTAYPAAPSAAHSVPVAWLPEDANFPPANGSNAYLNDQAWRWQEHPQHHALQRPRQYPQTAQNLAVQTHGLPPRPRSTSQVTPTIRVTTEQPYTPDSQAQPQDSHPTSATSLHAPYPYDNSSYIDHANLYPVQNYDMAEIQVQGPPQPQVGQIGPSNGIASPISDHPVLSRPISPSNVQMEDPNARKRSYSEMSQGPPQMHMLPPEHQSPQASAYETSPGGMEDQGHKVQRMIKRGDPPQAHDGKYYCSFAPECADQYFDRKCEWR